MSAFKVPDVERFEFEVPGDDTVHSIPTLLDLPPEKLVQLPAMARVDVTDISALTKITDFMVDLADTESARAALRTLSLGQLVKFLGGYVQSAGLDLGESSAS